MHVSVDSWHDLADVLVDHFVLLETQHSKERESKMNEILMSLRMNLGCLYT